ncbi:MAG: EpsD family peptidyl-prolyl cis-trans isomerase [Methylotenera sp.]|nr:EpsD family peptidyl-prolyl cis-trans isomerase [Methylotenera sp.]
MLFANKYLLLTLIVTTSFTAACGKKDEAESEKSETQVIAKVNGDEISIHQLNFQLARMGQVSEEQSKLASKQILTRLVDQQLLKQRALEAKLDRDPKTLQVIESAKDEILAQAYMDQLMSKAAKPTKAEIDTFYQDNPELFANRRIYRLQELVVNISKDKFAEVQAGLKDIKAMNEVALWLREKNYPFTANSNVRAAEQLPLEMLKKLHPIKDGEWIAVPTERSLNIVHLAASQSKPILRDDATPFIEQYFLNQNKSKLAKKEMETLNSNAKIEFVGAFSDMKKSPTDSAVTADAKNDVLSNQSEQVRKSQTDKTDNSTPSTKPSTDQSSIDKGLSGL